MFEEGKIHIEIWKKNKEELSYLFSKRQYEKASGPMAFHLNGFLYSLFSLNNKSFNEMNTNELNAFKYKPHNVNERVNFIQNNPKQYHSYIQLKELYIELEKIYARAEIKEKQNRVGRG